MVETDVQKDKNPILVFLLIVLEIRPMPRNLQAAQAQLHLQQNQIIHLDWHWRIFARRAPWPAQYWQLTWHDWAQCDQTRRHESANQPCAC